jgi:NAD+ synthase (glutamine-hydrolysing)
VSQASFFSIYRQGMLRATTVAPVVSIAQPAVNAERTLAALREAHASKSGLVVFPELGITGYAIDDLLLQDAVLDATEQAILKIVEDSKALFPVAIIGAPLRVDGRLFNCAVVIHSGAILGIVPKMYLPNYRRGNQSTFRHRSSVRGNRLRRFRASC